MAARTLEIRGNLENAYADVFTPEAVAALAALAGLDADRKAVMAARIERRAARARNKQRIAFLDPQATIARTTIKVQDARAGAFIGAEIPGDLRRHRMTEEREAERRKKNGEWWQSVLDLQSEISLSPNAPRPEDLIREDRDHGH